MIGHNPRKRTTLALVVFGLSPGAGESALFVGGVDNASKLGIEETGLKII